MMLEINCDMGEFETLELDLKLFPYIDILNIATGGHAGSKEHILELAYQAFQSDKLFSAHFGYDDILNFGRVEHNWTPSVILDQMKVQWAELPKLSDIGGWKWVKFHGALYNRLMKDNELAETLIRWLVKEGFEGLIAPRGSAQARVAMSKGVTVKYEVFLERRYVLNELGDFELMPRSMEGAVINNLADALNQYANIVDGKEIKIPKLCGGSSFCVMQGDTACVHSDSQIALELVRSIHELKYG